LPEPSRRRRGAAWALIGAGGHAKALVEAIEATGGRVAVYVDARRSTWLDRPCIARDADLADLSLQIAIGFGAIDPAGLISRLAKLDALLDRGFLAPPLCHPAAHVSAGATLAPGVVVLAGAVVQPGARIGKGVIVNSGAIVEHDAAVGNGSHVAPGAIVLGDASVGRAVMVGAGAVVIQGSRVPDRGLVRATSLWLDKGARRKK